MLCTSTRNSDLQVAQGREGEWFCLSSSPLTRLHCERSCHNWLANYITWIWHRLIFASVCGENVFYDSTIQILERSFPREEAFLVSSLKCMWKGTFFFLLFSFFRHKPRSSWRRTIWKELSLHNTPGNGTGYTRGNVPREWRLRGESVRDESRQY